MELYLEGHVGTQSICGAHVSKQKPLSSLGIPKKLIYMMKAMFRYIDRIGGNNI